MIYYDLNFDRRCQLYDTNYNSRFSYQYICSYDSSKDFANINKKKLKQKVNPDNVICIKFNELIENTIINNFKEVYNKKDLFLCSRTNMPQEKDYFFAKVKDCKMSKYYLMFLLFCVVFLQYIYPFLFMRSFLKLRRNSIRDRNDHLPVRNNRLGRAIFRIHNDLVDLERFFNIIRNIVILNNANASNNSTERSENPRDDIDFRLEKTINIIIENKKEFIIDRNIKNISSDKTKKMVNNINSGNINEVDLNSEETIIKNSDFKDDNINNQ